MMYEDLKEPRKTDKKPQRYMLSIPIRITKQEVRDFPLENLQIDPRWAHIIDPSCDHTFKITKPRKRKTL